MKLLVQHNLFNKRHKTRHEDSEEEEEATHKNMIILSSMFTSEKAKMNVQITTSTLIQSQNMTIITDANTYKIQTRHILKSEVIENLSSVTVIDVFSFSLH